MRKSLLKMKTYKYFTESEFARLSPSCSLANMSPDFMNRLDYARELYGKPIVLNCAYRSVSWDKLHGRSGHGYHTFGRAVDIKCTSSQERFALVKALLDAGFTGIGLYGSFIHVDDRAQIPATMFYGS